MTAIETKRLIQPEPIRAWGTAFGIVGGLMFLAMLATGFEPLAVVLICAFGGFLGLMLIIPVAQTARNVRGKAVVAEQAAKARRAMVTAIGREPIAIDTTGSLAKEKKGWISASGLAWDGTRIWVLDSGELASFPPEMVRRWAWRTRQASRTRVYGSGTAMVGAQLQVMGDNAEARAAAFADSGFFLTVADLARPGWQFMCEDVAVLERWEEILRQVGEGRLTA